MRTLSQRASSGLFWAAIAVVVAVLGIAAIGIVGVRSSSSAARGITRDELATSALTAQVARQIDAAHADGLAVILEPDTQLRGYLAQQLYAHDLPAAESGVAALIAMHAGDDKAELAEVNRFVASWAVVRDDLIAARSASTTRTQPSLVTPLEMASKPLNTNLDTLLARESHDARGDQAATAGTADTYTYLLAALALAVAIGVLIVAYLARTRVREAMEPAQEQIEFADTLQLAQDETEAQLLLQHYLEHALPGSAATIMNRNNSEDRLEAVTPLPDGSALIEGLQHAEPTSCLAVRSGRLNRRDVAHGVLLDCEVCSGDAGSALCNPLTVGGNVIGSVLVTRTAAYRPIDERLVSDSVARAAPVLANLRNLAISEIRAATDSLTGLPNKRAVEDTLKLMLAQASRSLEPLALLMLDLDHFKEVNDRFGHPVGDQALAMVGTAIRSALRDSDFAGRTGGEEFVVLLPGTAIDGAASAAEKIRTAIAGIELPNVQTRLTASLGLAVYPDHAVTADRLERLADAALYTAKRSGRDQTVIAAEPTPKQTTPEATAAKDQPANIAT